MSYQFFFCYQFCFLESSRVLFIKFRLKLASWFLLFCRIQLLLESVLLPSKEQKVSLIKIFVTLVTNFRNSLVMSLLGLIPFSQFFSFVYDLKTLFSIEKLKKRLSQSSTEEVSVLDERYLIIMDHALISQSWFYMYIHFLLDFMLIFYA